MLSFSSFIQASKNFFENKETKEAGTYISLLPNEASKQRIAGYIHKLGIKNHYDIHKLHCTVIYSRKSADIPDSKIDVPYFATGTSLELFDQQDGKKCLVLKLAHSQINTLHTNLKSMYRTTHDYPTYEAHITLARDLNSDFKLPADKPNIAITFTGFENKPLDLDVV